MHITMHEDEIALFSALLLKSRSYFEFGIGGSTCLAARLVDGPVYGIESSQEWIDKVTEELPADADVNLRYIDIGETGDWGTPTSREAEHRFPDYSRAIADPSLPQIDFCLVDGRFRVACFLEALRAIPGDGVVAMHDYTSRPNYHLVEEFARPIACAREFQAFVRRNDCDLIALEQQIQAYRLEWE